MRTVQLMLLLAVGCCTSPARAQMPKLREVPPSITGGLSRDLKLEHDRLALRRDQIRAQAEAHNRKCSSVDAGSASAASCANARTALQEIIAAYTAEVERFHQALERAKGASPVKEAVVDRIAVQPGAENPHQLRQELLGNLSRTIRERTDQPNQQLNEILRSLKTVEPPSPIKDLAALAPGDVVLVAPIPTKELLRDKQHFKDVIISNSINLLDRWGSDNWSSPASHAAIYLGERNGKRWYLDNTSENGPVIKEEKEFFKEYGERKMDVATLVGEPLSSHEGQELWKGAHELRNTTTYGIWANDRMVCSESSRWLLMRAGRRVPETTSKDKEALGLALNKRQLVDFSPSDFYADQQYFIVHQLALQKTNTAP